MQAQELTATEIVRKVTENKQGENLYSEVTMTIVRPTWTREVGLKNWTKGGEYSLVLITSPGKDKGQACYKITLPPKESAVVVWGKITMWITKEDFIEVKSEFYDEDNELENTYHAYDIQTHQGRKIHHDLK